MTMIVGIKVNSTPKSKQIRYMGSYVLIVKDGSVGKEYSVLSLEADVTGLVHD